MAANPASTSLSVIVTVYNETESIRETVQRLIKSTGDRLAEIILVVSPKSSAETMRICDEVADACDLVRILVQHTGPGVGRALQEGMAAASHEYVAIMSSDLETEPEAVDRMYRKMRESGADVVIGSRWEKGGGFVNYDRVKWVCNWLFQKMFRVIYGTRLNDLTYGFKLFRSEVVRSIPWESTHHTIYIETTLKPLLYGYRVEQVPTIWIGRREGVSVNPFVRNFEYVKLAIALRWQSLRRVVPTLAEKA
jgi:glycosyltransferase involved in cell wall biosynthesis